MYRSFVTCDDPKGVIECGTIRKAKTGSQKMEHDIMDRRTQRSSNASLLRKGHREDNVSKKVVEDYHSPSSLQLLEVSKGAQKLNQMIDTWSKGQSCGGQSKGIARDLLKGALDLQESLAMLGKLQEASQYMARLKKKQKEKSERGRIDDIEARSMNSYRFGDQRYQMGFEKPRGSDYGTSKDCIEELKKVISDSLARQNLLPETANPRRLDWRTVDSVSEGPSRSLSQSSMGHSGSSHSTDSYALESAPQKKERGPSLIARLMGLEDTPLQPLQKNVEKRLDTEKILSQRRPISDIEVPMVRKSQLPVHKADPEQRTLKEILESIQLRGLLKSNSVKEVNSQLHQTRSIRSKERSVRDVKPIVLIKPCVPCRESEEAVGPIVWQEEELKRKMMSRKKEVKEKRTLRSKGYKDREWNGSNMYCRREPEETQIRTRQGGNYHKEPNEPEEKEIKIIVHEEVMMSGSKSLRKLEAEEIPARRDQGEGTKDRKELTVGAEERKAKDRKELVVKAEEKKAKAIVKNPSTTEATVNHHRLKKVDTIQKVVGASRKPLEKEMLKPDTVSRHQVQAKVESTKPRKPENGIASAKTQLPKPHSSKPKNILKQKPEARASNFKDQKKKEKPRSEPAAAKPTNENIREKDDKSADLLCDNDIAKGTHSLLADQLSTEDLNASEIQTQERQSDSQSSNITLVTTEYEKDIEASEEAGDNITSTETDETTFKTESNLKALLLSCSSFLNHAEELFDLNIGCTQILPASGIDKCGVTDINLSLDYANEFIERRSLSCLQTRHPFLPILNGETRIHCSLDQLVEGILNGIEVLRNYSTLPHDKFPADTLYAILEADMNCKGVISGAWESGWRTGFSVDDAEKTVNQIESLLVNDLVDEIFSIS